MKRPVRPARGVKDEARGAERASGQRPQFDLFRHLFPSAGPSAKTEGTPAQAPEQEAEPAVPASPAPAATRSPDEAARPRIYSVTELTQVIKGQLEARFPRILVRGEVSNFKRHVSGHLYFSLKDSGAQLRAVMFRGDAVRLTFPVADGLAVVARGRVSVYEPRGEYQLVVDGLEPEGAGARAMALEALKARLRAEGLFDEAAKRPLPFIPRRIGVATSVRGAALHDFLRTLHERYPVPVLVADCRVQGEGAAEEIARAIWRLSQSGKVDVIVVTRGGGSVEDLWAFNEEVVVRAIRASTVPVVSAVGHEVDVTLSDFASDVRAATPTHAAKVVVPARLDLLARIEAHRARLASGVRRTQLASAQRVRLLQARLVDPRRRIAERRLRLDDLADGAARCVRGRLLAERDRMRRCSDRLAVAHPRGRVVRTRAHLTDLERGLARMPLHLRARRQRLDELRARLEALTPGYAVVYKGERVIRSIEQVAAGDAVRVDLPDGAFDAQVTRKRPPGTV